MLFSYCVGANVLYVQNYPGKAGQTFVGYNHTGIWIGDNVTPEKYLADVAAMEKYRWIDEHTAMANLGCTVELPTQNILLYFSYTYEFTSSGLVRPRTPFIGVSFINPIFNLEDKVDTIAMFSW